MTINSSGLRFHHVGVITRSLNDSMKLYADLGYSASVTYADPLQKVRIVLMKREDHPIIELITPDGADSPATSWIQRMEAGPYHTCYEVDDLEAVMALLRSQQLFPVLGPLPAVAFDMRRVVFLWSARSGLIELLDASPMNAPGLPGDSIS